MDDVRVGRVCRALRRRRGWRQLDLAVRAGCHQTTISRIERGQVDALAIRSVRAVFSALEARYDADVRWRGADLDRLLDERHALLVEHAAARFAAAGWEVIAEASFSNFGERGSIDLLAGHALTRVVAVGEIKGSIGDVQETLRRHDVKARLGRQVAAERFGWTPDRVVRVLVVPEDRTIRRIAVAHERTFRSAYPAGSREVQAWIRSPDLARSGLWFLTVKHPGHVRRRSGGRDRVIAGRTDAG